MIYVRNMVSFWKNDDNYIHNIILELGKKYKSTVFVPYITGIWFSWNAFAVLDAIVLKTIKDIKPFSVEKIRINYSDDLWKTLFIEINQNEYLDYINKKLITNFQNFQSLNFYHMSVLVIKT